LAFERVVVEEFLDEVDVRHEHAPAAVPLQVERVQGVSLGVIRLEQVQVRVPLVSDHLRAERGVRIQAASRIRGSRGTSERTAGRGEGATEAGPRTLPQVKQRTGMIMAADFERCSGPRRVTERRSRGVK
jgi:hypothetical protein